MGLSCRGAFAQALPNVHRQCRYSSGSCDQFMLASRCSPAPASRPRSVGRHDPGQCRPIRIRSRDLPGRGVADRRRSVGDTIGLGALMPGFRAESHSLDSASLNPFEHTPRDEHSRGDDPDGDDGRPIDHHLATSANMGGARKHAASRLGHGRKRNTRRTHNCKLDSRPKPLFSIGFPLTPSLSPAG